MHLNLDFNKIKMIISDFDGIFTDGTGIVEDSKLTPSQIVYIGDDINDMPSLQYAGFKVTVPNANYVIKEIKEIQITEKKGGEGVFREVVDAVIYNKFDTSLFAGEK